MPPAKQPSAAPAPPLAGHPPAAPQPSPDDHDASRAAAEPPKDAREPIGARPPGAAPPPLVSVVGRSEAEIVRLLGAPSSEMVEPPAKKLTFAVEACSLEIYLFPEMAQGGFRALDEKATGGLPVAQCLARLRAARGTGGRP